jgi:non-specific serine/threonine protein kinase
VVDDDAPRCERCGADLRDQYAHVLEGLTGPTLGGYVIEEELGRGGMGIVYRARDEALGRRVALKVIAPDFARDRSFRERFRRESRLAAHVEHPAVVPIYGAGEDHGRLFIAMRFIDGTDLATVLRQRGALPAVDAVALIGQVAGALDAAHARGLVHRDVKPANVLLSPDVRRAFLTDFGLTLELDQGPELTRTGSWLGTPAYAAPEQLRGGAIDARTDVYALGGVLYHCLTGQVPYPAASAQEAVSAHLLDPPPRPSAVDPGLPRALDTVVAHAMSKDPEARFRSAGELADKAAAALRGEPARPGVPLPMSQLIGREPDLRVLRSLLDAEDMRLITLTGPGGAGKTHLALSVANEVADRFAAGTRVALLAGVAEADLVLPSVANALGVRAEAGRPLMESILREIENLRMLLVLDNLEHLLDAAPLVGALLAGAPSLKVLATSRAPLRLAGEREYAVPPLSDVAAVELFIARARAVRGDFPVDDDATGLIREITVQLDRLPLAIELAAARTRVLPPAALLERLDRRFELLVGGRRDQPERHRTLRATIAWSHDLLSEDAQTLLSRLAVFAGGFSLDLATALAADGPDDDIVDDLDVLLENSLARPAGSIAGEPRYLLLESVRAFALGRLGARGEAEIVRGRHADVMVDFMEHAAQGLATGDQVNWLDRLDAELDNLRKAMAWITETGSGVHALRIAAASGRYGLLHGRWSELRGWAEYGLTYGPMEMPALYTQALVAAGNLARWDGDAERAEVVSRKLLDFADRHRDPHGRAHALNGLGIVITAAGDYAGARTLLEEALPLCREVADMRLLSAVLNNLGDVALQTGDFLAARRRFEESADVARQLGRDDVVTMAQANLAASLLELGEVGRCRDVLLSALRRAQALGYPDALYGALATLPALALAEGDMEAAARLSGAVEAAFEAASQRFDAFEGRRHAELLAALRQSLPPARFEALRAEGGATTVAQILAAALR